MKYPYLEHISLISLFENHFEEVVSIGCSVVQAPISEVIVPARPAHPPSNLMYSQLMPGIKMSRKSDIVAIAIVLRSLYKSKKKSLDIVQ